MSFGLIWILMLVGVIAVVAIVLPLALRRPKDRRGFPVEPSDAGERPGTPPHDGAGGW